MATKRVIILDYGAGNLRSVARAVEHVGFNADVSDDPRSLDDADAVIMPGVGAAADTMRNLNEREFSQPLRDYIATGRPFFGVCMGLQALLTVSDEGGDHPCLDVLSGRVRRFERIDGMKIPHMGWNSVQQVQEHSVFEGIPDGSFFYFVHGYYPDPEDESIVIGRTDYGLPFASVIAKDNLIATQFHPEKSGRVGLRLYKNFLEDAVS